MNLNIDGKKVTADKGEYILHVARRNGIEIPTMCDHPAIEPFGSCRLCLVEITRPEWEGWSRLVTSCLYPVQDGLIVNTNSDKVRRTRAVILDLLMARCPEAKEIREMAREYGVTETSFVARKDADKCILCGRCMRICEVIGAAAVSTTGRGVHKLIEVPLAKEDLSTCIGCLSCAKICPTGAIEYEESDNRRKIWDIEFQIVNCKECGAPLGTPQELKHFAQKTGLGESYFEYCPLCNNRRTADKLASITFKK